MPPDSELDGTVKRERIITIVLLVLCQSFQALAIGGIALFLPLIRKDIGLSFTQGGTLSAASSLTYCLMQIPAGYLSDRFSPKRLFCLGIFGTTVLAFTFGLVSQYWQAVSIQALSGVFRSFLFAPGVAMLRGWFPKNRQATATGLFMVGGLSGNVILDMVGPFLITKFGWRFPFLSFSSVGIISSLILLRFGKEPPLEAKGQKVKMFEVLHLLRYRFMWVCGVIQYMRMVCMSGINFWLPTLLFEDKGLSLQVAGMIIALRAMLTAPSDVLGGYVSDKLRNPPLIIGVSLFMLALTAPLFVIINNQILLIVVIAINAVFIHIYFGPLFHVPVEILGSRTAGMSSGLSNFFATIGGLTSVYLLGLLKDATGSFKSGFFAISGACIVGLVFTILLARVRQKALMSKASDVEAS